ncbi:hypothetical protein M3Y94_00571400 [Aphelenchoides besseyi]|nr:hypothetical protein M3Y94_00571400 [Aphelenchoides besseyi]KAI6218092.1 hypothetical protein M3Y95_01183500 [Aphelenchoides besseyi]
MLRLSIAVFWLLTKTVESLSCIDCGVLDLPSNSCDRNRECYNGYCTYYNVTVQNRASINFRCSSVGQLNGPGGSVFSTLNKCTIIRDGDTYYRMKICNDRDLCNSECNSSHRHLSVFVLLIVLTTLCFLIGK